VIVAEDPEDAIAIADDRSVHFDLLLSDVIMPRLNGPQIAERIVAMRPGLSVLYMSGYTDRAIHLHETLGSQENFIQKPFTAAALGQKLRELLSAGTGPQAL
jgi:DNA-binding NtrC family response regulator